MAVLTPVSGRHLLLPGVRFKLLKPAEKPTLHRNLCDVGSIHGLVALPRGKAWMRLRDPRETISDKTECKRPVSVQIVQVAQEHILIISACSL